MLYLITNPFIDAYFETLNNIAPTLFFRSKEGFCCNFGNITILSSPKEIGALQDRSDGPWELSGLSIFRGESFHTLYFGKQWTATITPITEDSAAIYFLESDRALPILKKLCNEHARVIEEKRLTAMRSNHYEFQGTASACAVEDSQTHSSDHNASFWSRKRRLSQMEHPEEENVPPSNLSRMSIG